MSLDSGLNKPDAVSSWTWHDTRHVDLALWQHCVYSAHYAGVDDVNKTAEAMYSQRGGAIKPEKKASLRGGYVAKGKHVIMRFAFGDSVKRAYRFSEALQELGVEAKVASFRDGHWGVETDTRALRFADKLIGLIYGTKA